MLPLRYVQGWRTVGVVLLLFVLAAAVAPAVWLWPDRVRIVSWFGGIDKWAHAVTFAVLAIWFSGQYRRSSYWRIAVGLLVFGMLIELCQRMISYRSAEWFDVAANTVGIAVGLAIAAIGVGGWSLRFESWLLARRA